MKLLTIEELVMLNQYMQGVITKSKVDQWFLPLPEADRQSVVKNVWMLATQAQIREADIPFATKAAGLKRTHTPVVMISKADLPFKDRGYLLSTLSGTVLNQAFWLILECFSLAERRRMGSEDLSRCNHWWHRDLSNNVIVEEILKSKGNLPSVVSNS